MDNQVKSYEVRSLTSTDVRFERIGDTLAMTLNDGGCAVYYPWVVVRSCFPVSDDKVFLSVRDATAEEQDEIGIIDDWTTLRETDREAIAAELGLHYFVPQITGVMNVKEEFGFLYWTVGTNKGPKEFVMRDSVVHYTREIGPGHYLIIDVNQARYEIPDVGALDAHSQKLVRLSLRL